MSGVDPDLRGESRSSSLFRGRSRALGVLTAGVSTIIVLTLIGLTVVNSPGWERVQGTFFDADQFAKSLPKVLAAFALNVRLFLVSEALILVVALLLAVMRSLREPVFFPLRLFATAYIDIFRGIPSILIIYLLGFGIPALRIQGVTTDAFVWAVVALVLVWSAYVAEVYRAGIDSVHPSQDAAARSLGLSGVQSLRFVVLPQAIRRVIPPLLNDFIGLQKDTALVAFIGPIEAFRRSQIEVASTFNYTPYLVSALIFLVLTIPMARFVDWLVARDRRRQMAGAR